MRMENISLGALKVNETSDYFMKQHIEDINKFDVNHSYHAWIAITVIFGLVVLFSYSVYQRKRVVTVLREMCQSSIERKESTADLTLTHLPHTSLAKPELPQMSQRRARLMLVCCAIMYGSNFVGTKYMQRSIFPSILTTLRFFIGFLVFLPTLIKYYKTGSSSGEMIPTAGAQHKSNVILNLLLGKMDGKLVVCSIELGVWCAIGYNVQSATLNYTSASKNAFLSSLSVVIVPMLDIIAEEFFSGKIEKSQAGSGGGLGSNQVSSPSAIIKVNTVLHANDSVIGTCIHILKTNKKLIILIPAIFSLLGVGVLELGGIDPPHVVDMFVCIVPFSFAMCLWKSEKLTESYPNESYIITGILLGTTCVLSFLFAILIGEVPSFTYLENVKYIHTFSGGVLTTVAVNNTFANLIENLMNWKILIPLLYTGLFTTAYTSYIEQMAVKILSAGEITVIYSLEPLFGTIFAHFLIHEHIGIDTMIGAFLIITACLYQPVILPNLSYTPKTPALATTD